jgi:lipoprotein-anchoring transpeptidase ErfK/SrfK
MWRIGIRPLLNHAAATIAMAGAALVSPASLADPLSYAPAAPRLHRAIEQALPEWRTSADRQDTAEASAYLRRRIVDYQTRETPGTIIVDTPNTQLYLVLAGGKAIRYGIGVGRHGFTWSGVAAVERKAEWPDWLPPEDMLRRQPYLPRFMAGGPSNPLGARALYLGGTVYRIHGTNDPSTIGKRVSSGCFRMLNDDVIDLYARVNIGTKVVVLPSRSYEASNRARQARFNASSTRTMTADRGAGRRVH